jgi:alpha-glucosidase
MFAGMGLSGFSFVGADIGGFAEAPTGELFTRWIQAGVFYPFMRTHTTFGTPDQEPWSYGTYHEALNRRAIELRYELLPHIYNAMKEASETGIPAFRPLLLDYPNDPATWGRDDEFLFGSDLLVAPVLRAEITEREVYLPAGEWYDFWTGERREGGRGFAQPVTMEAIPVFVRAGAFIFRQPVVQHTGEMAGQPLRVDVYPAAQSSATLYEDDGESLDYQRGAFLRRRFTQARDSGRVTIDVGAAEGSYRPAGRDLVLRVRWDGEPARATVAGAPVVSTAEGRFVTVRLPDRFDSFRVTIEKGPG